MKMSRKEGLKMSWKEGLKQTNCRLFMGVLAVIMLFQSGQAEANDFYGDVHNLPFLAEDNGKPVGIVADIFAEIEKRSDLDLSLKLMNLEDAQARIRDGKGTGLVQISKNPDRERYLDFSEALLTSDFIVFHRHTDFEIQTLDDLVEKTVGVVKSSYPFSLVRAEEQIEKYILKDGVEGFQLLHDGEIDAVIMDRWIGEYLLKQSGIAGIVPSAKPIASRNSYIGVRKDRPDILAQINSSLASMREDGRYQEIAEKWRFSEGIYITDQEQFLETMVYGLFTLVIILICGFIFLIFKLRTMRKALNFEQAVLDERVNARTLALQHQAEREQVLRQKAEEAEAEALKLALTKTNFLATMSHELRTPLNAVIGFSDVLENSTKHNCDIAIIQKYAGVISASGRDLLHLINDILDFAKIDSGMIELDKTPFELGHEINNIQSAFNHHAHENGVTLDIPQSSETLVVNGDAARFRQVVHNLVDNAIKFSKGGSVTITVDHAERDKQRRVIIVRVEDSGRGIPKEQQDQIFNLFTQEDGSITRKFGGTGLGLSISRSLTQIMGGDLTVESEAGQGSIFTATFEFEDLTELTKILQKKNTQTKLNTAKTYGLSILAVDDVETNLLALEAMAVAMGCELHHFSDPEQAILWSRHNTVDMVMMDIHMPQMDGMTCINRIREVSPAYQITPVYAWTADAGFQHMMSKTDVDWYGVILKPLVQAELRRTLDAFLEDRRPRR